MTIFQKKLTDFDILGIIYIIELLKCLEFFHVETNNMPFMVPYLTITTNNIFGIQHFENCGKKVIYHILRLQP